MASQNKTTKKEQLGQCLETFKNQSKKWMDQKIWERAERLVNFEYEHAAPGPHMTALFSIMFGLGHIFGIGAVPKSSEPMGLPFWAVYVGVFLWGYSHNDEGRKIIGNQIELFFGDYLKPKAKSAGSLATTLASSAGNTLPLPSIRVLKWFERLTIVGIAVAIGFASYSLFPFVYLAVTSIAPSLPINLALVHSVIFSLLPLTLLIFVAKPIRRILFLRYRRKIFYLGVVLGILQLMAMVNIALGGVIL